MSANQQALLMASNNAVTVDEACVADPYYSCGPTNDPYWANVVLLLHMDGTDGSTTFTDSSSYARAMTAAGNAQIDTAEFKFGTASGLFDGTGDNVQTPNGADFQFLGDFTVEAWVRPTTTGSFTNIFIQDNGTVNAWWLRKNNLNELGYGVVGGSDLLTGGTINSNVWTHVAICRSGTTLRLFVNGLQVNAGTGYAATIGIDTGTAEIGGGSFAYTGNIDDLRITKGVARYTGNFTIPTAAFPDALEVLTKDEYWSDVRFLSHLDGSPGATSATDASLSNNPPVFYSTAAISASSKFGTGAVALNGTSDYLQTAAFSTVPTTGTGGYFCLECWFYPTSTGSTKAIIGMWDTAASNVGWVIEKTSAEKINLFIGNSGLGFNRITGATPITSNAWHHMAFTRDASGMRLWLDGVLEGTWASDGGGGSQSWSYSIVLNYLLIGAYRNNSDVKSEFFAGRIDEIRLTFGNARYTSAFAVPTAAFVEGAAGRTILSLHAEDATDSSCYQPKTVTLAGTASVTDIAQKFGTYSFAVPNSGSSTANGVVITDHMDLDFGTGDFTIEMWAYRSSNDYAGTLFYYTETAAFSLVVETTGLVTLNYRSSGGTQASIATGVTFPLTTWQHVVVQRRGTNFEFYLEGVLGNTTAITGGASSTVNSTGDFYLGRTNASSALSWNGYIDEVRITKGVARYTEAFDPATMPNCDSVLPGKIVAVEGTAPLTGASVTVRQQSIGSQEGFVALQSQAVTVSAWAPFADVTTQSKTVALTGRNITVSRGSLAVPRYPDLSSSNRSYFIITSPTTASLTVTFSPDGTWSAVDGEGATRFSGTWIDTAQTAYDIESISHLYRVLAVNVFVGYAPYYSYPMTPFTLSSDFVFVAQNLIYGTTVNFDFQVTIAPTSANPRYGEAYYYGTHRFNTAIELAG